MNIDICSSNGVLSLNDGSFGTDWMNRSKSDKKRIGQFFTDERIAEFMASMFSCTKRHVSILDPGAGTGILSTFLLKALAKNGVESVYLSLCENDSSVIEELKRNIDECLKQIHMHVTYEIVDRNFLLTDFRQKYDFIISNPPYKKLRKNDPESIYFQDVVHGQPNLYMLFMAKGVKLLKQYGEMVFITPRSFMSGAYFQKFRAFLKQNGNFEHIHLFKDRKKHFSKDNILQEIVISKYVKRDIESVTITQSEGGEFDNMSMVSVNDKLLWDEHLRIRLPVSDEDVKILERFDSTSTTLFQCGYRVSTGKVVPFRHRKFLKKRMCAKCVPLLWMHNFSSAGKMVFSQNKEKNQYIEKNSESMKLLIPSSNYIVIKRFSSKEQKRRINVGVILERDLPADYFALENHLNYLYRIDRKMDEREIGMLLAFLSSDEVDKYFRIVNGSTQVNAQELLTLPVPKKLYRINLRGT